LPHDDVRAKLGAVIVITTISNFVFFCFFSVRKQHYKVVSSKNTADQQSVEHGQYIFVFFYDRDDVVSFIVH